MLTSLLSRATDLVCDSEELRNSQFPWREERKNSKMCSWKQGLYNATHYRAMKYISVIIEYTAKVTECINKFNCRPAFVSLLATQCHAGQYSAVGYIAILCSVVRCDAVQCRLGQYYIAILYFIVYNSKEESSMALSITGFNNTIKVQSNISSI